MKVIIAAGGTGGHIFPGIALGREFLRRDPNSRVTFVGTPRGLESRIVPENGFELEMIRIGALKGVSMATRLTSLAQLPFSMLSARRLLRRLDPDVVIGVGGYASGPVLLMASLMKYPTMVVEPNAMPGFTNRILARFVDAAAVTFEEAKPTFRGRAVLTGNPVRGDFGDIQRKQRTAQLHVLVFGGSQGARAINQSVPAAVGLLGELKESLSITHQTGEREMEDVRSRYDEAGFEHAEVLPFIGDMPRRFEQADILICRSGATTAAEVAAAGKAAIFIPFPFATDDHQRRNAEAFKRAGAGRMILQKDLTPARLADELREIIRHPEEIDRMELASRGLGNPDSTRLAVDLAVSVTGR